MKDKAKQRPKEEAQQIWQHLLLMKVVHV